MKGGFPPNQLVVGRNHILPNLMGDDKPSCLERGGRGKGGEEYLRRMLDDIHRSRIAHIKQESREKRRQALKHKIRKHRVECAEIGDQVDYKKEEE